MNHRSFASKTSRQTKKSYYQESSSGKNGISIAPPQYGIDIIDRQPESAGPLSLDPLAPIQAKPMTAPPSEDSDTSGVDRKNKTGLPNKLKAGIENLSGLSMDDVKVHYHSPKPYQLQALAYTQGTDIHVGPGQEQHLPHEAWHVVQQAQGRVQPTMQMKDGAPVNDDEGLEHEADKMGEKAVTQNTHYPFPDPHGKFAMHEEGLRSLAMGPTGNMPIMRKLGFEYELGGLNPKKNTNWTSLFAPTWKQMKKGEVIDDKGDYQITADVAEGGSNNLEFITRPFDESDPGELGTVAEVAESIKADIEDMTKEQFLDTDVPLDQLSRVSGPSSIFIHVREANPLGQIQMTGGVDLLNLPGIMSGKELGEIPNRRLSKEESSRAMPLQNYYEIGIDGPTMGLIYNIAKDFVQVEFDSVGSAGQGMIAAVGAMMAQTIIEQRVVPFELRSRAQGGYGRFIAKTDFAMILQLIDEKINSNIDWARFPAVVLATANELVDVPTLQEHENAQSLTPESPVFPPYYKVTEEAISFPELTIGQWVSSALPQGRKQETEEVYEDYGYTGVFVERETGRMIPVGQDLLTKAHYPGSPKQRGELGAYGAYGSKTDPDEKVILEWRDLKKCDPSILPDIIGALFKYYSDIGISGLFKSIELDIPAYRALVEDMPPGKHKTDAIEYYNFALDCFEDSNLETYEDAQSLLSIAQKYLRKAHDSVIEERIEKERAARYR